MLTNQDRKHLEETLILSVLTSKTYFLQVYNQNYDPIDLFINTCLRAIYLFILDYFHKQNKLPVTDELYRYLLSRNAAPEVKRTYMTLAGKDYISREADEILLADTIEREIYQVFERNKKGGLTGILFAENIREDVDSVLLSKLNKYIKDSRSNLDKVEATIQKIKSMKEGTEFNFLKTGFDFIDKYVNGIPKGHLTIIAARPSMGKTAFMLQLKRNFLDQNLKVGIISLEMTGEELLMRDLSYYSGIDSLKIERGELTDDELNNIARKANPLVKDNYFIDDSSKQTLESIKAIIRAWMIKYHIDIIFIDYLTLIKTEIKKFRHDLEIGRLSQELRALAKETDLPIVILSQLNRQSESRNDKRPSLADLRESGQIEQDAKLVMFLYRPCLFFKEEYSDTNGRSFLKNHKNFETADGNQLTYNEYIEIIIAKARAGKTGTVPLRYIPAVHAFENVFSRKKTPVPDEDWHLNNDEPELPI